MAGEIVYADLRHPGESFSSAKKCHTKVAALTPALCPRWHGVLLKASALGHLILLVLVAVLSGQVFQGCLQPAATVAPRQGNETWGRNHTERCVLASLMGYFCKSQQENLTACAGCKLCPQNWQLHGDMCYQLSKEKGEWTRGKKGCENQESQLVVLRNEKEKEYIKNMTGRGAQPVWIGLMSSRRSWIWVDHTPFNTKMFGTLQEADDGCGTLKDAMLEIDTCKGEHEWVCQKEPFQLSPLMAEGGEKCDGSI
ncbi:killer cell lectin-like receptor subfamily B member 1B allele A [Falco naumanni]|uniref:killer cell lectin-like receptor subfamily B member 1B allele A n=1 Tax=Falco naumanni TaxID=148594 RepID=UPI001ADDF509|nr:killer cell lectin-like receptor subfamily B member 1B allele A [Falco naumanni]XP_040434102.1 killer cell lectin-like receptor subfamily B member 1B allele A [Falco naumanni]